MKTAFLLIGIAACSQSQATTTSPDDAPAIVLLARAERLRLEWTPNYRHPIVETDDTIERSEELYARACERGAPFACWHAPGGARALLEQCRAGDMLSCRNFTDQAPTVRAFRDLPGTAARNYRWGVRKAVRMEDLRHECELGLPDSCLFYIQHEQNAPDVPRLRKRLLALATEGCTMGILDDCRVLGKLGTPEAARIEDVDRCVWTGWCEQAARNTDDPIRARDFLERSCQMLSLPSYCGELAVHYVSGEYPEPVPGRGKQLLEWACARLEPDLMTQSAYGCPPDPDRIEDDDSGISDATRKAEAEAIDANIAAAHAAMVSVQSGNDDLNRASAHLDALHDDLLRADRATRRKVHDPVRKLLDEARALRVSSEELQHALQELEKLEP